MALCKRQLKVVMTETGGVEQICIKESAVGRSFVKMHGLRNHFVIIDGRTKAFTPSKAEIVEICDVNQSVGADQLLILETPSEAGAALGASVFFRILNIDGLEVSACGNATRCVAHLMLEEKGLEEIILETKAGTLECRRVGKLNISVNMGRISTEWEQMPLANAQDMACLPISNGPLKKPMGFYIGNPHVVFFVDSLDAIDMHGLCPTIQNDPLFPEQVNVGVAEIVNDHTIKLAVYERPGILTQACGSGACVAVFAAQMRGLIPKAPINVEMPAGSVEIEIKNKDTVVMTGPVAYSFFGQLPSS